MEKNIERECIAGIGQQGLRLDAALAALFPSLGLRGRRRLWQGHLVLVDGTARSPAFRLRGGERIRLEPKYPSGAGGEAFPACSDDPPRLLARRDSLFFLYKPGGLHTEIFAGGAQPGLAGLLANILPDAPAVRLLTRLDQETSGIVIAAGDEEAVRQWRQRENAGGMEKWYLALLEGELDSERTVRNALDLAKKRRTRVSDADGPALRHTRMRPLACFHAADAPALASGYPGGALFTLALCRIAKGARHQIRAHAAHAGHPLAGDALYGAQGGSPFLLHHCRIRWTEGQVTCLPPWLARLPASAGARIRMLCDCMEAMSYTQALP